MKFIFRIPAALVLAALLACCNRNPLPDYDAIRYVDELMSDSLSYVEGLASLAGQASGSVVLIGEPDICVRTGEELLSADQFDNIDGRPVPDGLPDFAGETFCIVLDCANAPYDGYVSRNIPFLRETAMRQTVFALDTLCRTNLYVPSAVSVKRPAKALVLCSDDIIRETLPDILDFLDRIRVDIPIVFATDSAGTCPAELYEELRSRRLFTHEIDFPKTDAFMTYPARDLSLVSRTDSTGAFLPEFKYGRPADEPAATFSMIRLQGMPGQKLRDLYVQNQY